MVGSTSKKNISEIDSNKNFGTNSQTIHLDKENTNQAVLNAKKVLKEITQESTTKPSKNKSSSSKHVSIVLFSVLVLVNHIIYSQVINNIFTSSIMSGEELPEFILFGNGLFFILTLSVLAYSFNLYFKPALKSALKLKPTRALLELFVFIALITGVLSDFFNGSFDEVSEGLKTYYYKDLLIFITAFSIYKWIDFKVYLKLEQISKNTMPTSAKLISKEVANTDAIDKIENLKAACLSKDVRELKDADKILLEPADILAVDVRVVSGLALVEQFCCRENDIKKVVKSADSKISAGSKILKGTLVCEVLGKADESDLSFFLDHVGKIQSGIIEESQIKSLINSERWYNLILLFIAATVSIYWYQQLLATDKTAINKVMNIAASILILGLLPRVWMFKLAINRVVPLGIFKRGLIFVGRKLYTNLSKVSKFWLVDEPEQVIAMPWISSFNLLDQRVELSKFMPLLAQLIYMSQDVYSEAFDQYFEHKKIKPSLEDFEHFFITPNKGAQITIKGAHLMFGSEQYLLENKITIQRSDIDESEQALDKRFVVLNNLVIATFTIQTSKVSDSRHFVATLAKKKIPTSLLSFKEPSLAKYLAKVWGVKEGQLLCHKDLKAFVASVNEQSNNGQSEKVLAVGLLGKEEAYQINNNPKVITFGQFDDVEYGLNNFDGTIVFNKDWYLHDLVKYLGRLDKFNFYSNAFSILMGIILLTLAASGILNVWQITLILSGFLALVYWAGVRLVR